METIKSFTDIEQAKKLAEILPLESADSHYVRNTHDFMGNPVDGKWSHPKYGNPNSQHAHYVVPFEQRCEIVRRTVITTDMTYEERLAAQRSRYGL